MNKKKGVQGKHYTRGELAKLGHVGIEAIRFYEQKGLLPRPNRLPSGYRQYSPDTVKRLLFIQRAKELGFSLKEISELLSLSVNPSCSCKEVKNVAEEKVRDVKDRIRGMRKIERVLIKLIASCRGRGPTSDCPILEALDRKGHTL